MSKTQQTAEKAPWHLWVVSVLAMLWCSMGVIDFLMTQTRNEAYMSNFTPQQIEFFYSLPPWVLLAWAVAVWGGVLGAVLLILRRRFAVQVFLVSFIAMVLSTFHNYLLSDGMKVMGDPFSLIFSAAIFLIALALFVCAHVMYKRGVLV